MLELADWLQQAPFDARPWLLLGKGPTFGRRGEFDLTPFHTIGMNHVVREQRVNVAHVIDVDVIAACAEALSRNADWLVMPRHPHVANVPGPTRPLESFFCSHPVLQDFADRGRLVWYDLRSKTCPVHGRAQPLQVRFFSSEAALQLAARLGAKTVRSLGIDGGRAYGAAFRDLAHETLLANGQPTFDLQFRELDRIAAEHGLDWSSLIEPMRIFIGGDETEDVAARVLEHTIREHASGPVAITIMRDYAIPVPKDPANRARTKFSFYRLRIPELCGYRGRALYLDSDMQVFRDVAELWRIPFGTRRLLCTNQPETPAAWKDNPAFEPGRHFAVMLLDCERLPWKVEQIVQHLDAGKYGYADLMHRMCLVRPDEIGDGIPVEWNHLETHVPGRTALTHFTVVPTQPWKTDATPLNALWMAAYERAVAAGAVDPAAVRRGVEGGWYKRGLLPALANAPAFWSWQPAAPAPDPAAAGGAARSDDARLRDANGEIERLRREIDALRSSWTWRVGRMLTRPLGVFARRARAPSPSS
jgi:hypothetical protein